MCTERPREETARLHLRAVRVDTAVPEDELTAQVPAGSPGSGNRTRVTQVTAL